jgi:hypothetical protein
MQNQEEQERFINLRPAGWTYSTSGAQTLGRLTLGMKLDPGPMRPAV